TLGELNNHLDFLESNPALKGLIIRSAKPKIFIAGADLNGFTQDLSPERLGVAIQLGQKLSTGSPISVIRASLRFMALPWVAGWKLLSPATAGSPHSTPRQKSGFRRRHWEFCRLGADRRVCRNWWACRPRWKRS